MTAEDFTFSNLTERQKLLWVEYALDTEDVSNNMVMTFQINGPVDSGRFEAAVVAVVQQSETLRLVFDDHSGSPVQMLGCDSKVYHEFRDLRQWSASEQRDWVDKRSSLSFDLKIRGYDSVLLHVGNEQFVWYLCIHHILTDGHSFSVLYRKVRDEYKEPNGDRSTRSITQYNDQEREYLRSKAFSRDREYWKSELSEVVPVFAPNRRVSNGSGRILRKTLLLSEQSSRRLTAIAAFSELRLFGEGLSRFVVLLSLFSVFLSRAGGEARVSIGFPTHNRSNKKLKEILGPVLDLGVLRTNVDQDGSFLELAMEIRQVLVSIVKHSRYCLSNPARTPNFHAMLNYNTAQFEPFDGFETVVESFSGAHSKYFCSTRTHRSPDALSLQCSDFAGSGRLKLDFDFSSSYFDNVATERAVAQFRSVVESCFSDPMMQLRKIDILTSEERTILKRVNATDGKQPCQSDTIASLFLLQARQYPDKLALVDGIEKLTYSELDVASDDLAIRLRSSGATESDVVAICLRPSIDLYVGLLSILKIGAIYLPVDPDYPVDRISFMFETSLPKLVLTHTELAGLVGRSTNVVLIDDVSPSVPSISALEPQNDAHDSLYHLYTSGSTGQPKGIVGSQRATINRLQWMWDTFPFEECDVCCQKTTLGFVDSVWEIFGPLLQGIKTVVIPTADRGNPRVLLDHLSRFGVTRAVFVPSLLAAIVDEMDQGYSEDLSRLSLWIVSGEPLPKSLVERFRKIFPDATLLNLYGSTEVAGDATFHIATGTATTIEPIGRPISNTKVYVLDAAGNQCPIGVNGELIISGIALANGYLNATGEDGFVDSVVGLEDQAGPFFRTGDVCRFMPDGELEYVGRTDDQIKLRGQRVELQEVEHALRRNSFLKEAVAAASGDDSLRRFLVAYVVPVDRSAFSVERAKRQLASTLPAHMIPSSWVILGDLPRLPNGKVDRKGLPDPAALEKATGLAPANDVESGIKAVWSHLLNIDELDVTTDFFQIGGNSILGVVMLNRIEEQLGVIIPLDEFFNNPTIRGLAAASKVEYVHSRNLSVQLSSGHAREPLFCICGVHVYQELAASLGNERPVFGLFVPEELELLAPKEVARKRLISVEELAAKYVELIQLTQPEGPYYLAGLSYGGVVGFEVAQQLKARGDEVALVAMFDSMLPSAIKINPLTWIRSKLIALSGRGHQTAKRIVEMDFKPRTNESSESTQLEQLRWQRFTRSLAEYQHRMKPYHGDVFICQATRRAGYEGYSIDLRTFWEDYIDGSVSVVDVAGDHTDVLRQPHIAAVAPALLAEMKSASKRSSGTT